MWKKLRKALTLFPTVVLTWVEGNGYPVSARIQPDPVDGAEVLQFAPPVGLELRAGPASILGHSHDEETWNLKSFLARGRLEHSESGWVFRPLVFVPGVGVGSPLDQLRPVLRMRPNAKRYLKRRGLERPAIPWDKIESTH